MKEFGTRHRRRYAFVELNDAASIHAHETIHSDIVVIAHFFCHLELLSLLINAEAVGVVRSKLVSPRIKVKRLLTIPENVYKAQLKAIEYLTHLWVVELWWSRKHVLKMTSHAVPRVHFCYNVWQVDLVPTTADGLSA